MPKRYYTTGNTSEGFVNFTYSNIKDIKRVIVLKHDSNKVKTSVIDQIIKKYEASDQLEIILSPLGGKYRDGVIWRDKGIAIITDQIAPNKMDIEICDLEKIFPANISQHELQQQIDSATQKAYENFATGLSIHDKLEKIYVDQMDFNRANELASHFIQNLLVNQPDSQVKGKIRTRLFGTNTPDGAVNVVPELIKDIANVCYIKGRAGTGKSTFMKKIVSACTAKGLDVELYRCSFDPSGLDMVIVRDLDFCIFDSTDPHEYFPQRKDDQVLDLYDETVTPGTDEKFAVQIKKLTAEYKSYMKQGIKKLKDADVYREQMERMYSVPDENEMNKLVNNFMHLDTKVE
ncbi:hypothetical protein ABRT01_07480 [Lentibacillus sp. L22]|uniref:hypothetical protein n=1 Tax=Lentibacillus TaxID=175304 RepID=UPI0022B18195|nr:hypothetical protein [Lentibacillus daqui]